MIIVVALAATCPTEADGGGIRSTKRARGLSRGGIILSAAGSLGFYLAAWGLDSIPLFRTRHVLSSVEPTVISGKLGPGWADADHFEIRNDSTSPRLFRLQRQPRQLNTVPSASGFLWSDDGLADPSWANLLVKPGSHRLTAHSVDSSAFLKGPYTMSLHPSPVVTGSPDGDTTLMLSNQPIFLLAPLRPVARTNDVPAWAIRVRGRVPLAAGQSSRGVVVCPGSPLLVGQNGPRGADQAKTHRSTISDADERPRFLELVGEDSQSDFPLVDQPALTFLGFKRGDCQEVPVNADGEWDVTMTFVPPAQNKLSSPTNRWQSAISASLVVAVCRWEDAGVALLEQAKGAIGFSTVDEALPAYRKAVARYPEEADLHASMARRLIREDRFVEAIEPARSALSASLGSLFNDPREARDLLAHALFGAGQYAEALEQWDRVQKEDPDFFGRRFGCRDDPIRMEEARRRMSER